MASLLERIGEQSPRISEFVERLGLFGKEQNVAVELILTGELVSNPVNGSKQRLPFSVLTTEFNPERLADLHYSGRGHFNADINTKPVALATMREVLIRRVFAAADGKRVRRETGLNTVGAVQEYLKTNAEDAVVFYNGTDPGSGQLDVEVWTISQQTA